MKNGQLINYYQPIIDNKSDVVALEALVRLKVPNKGVLYPSAFLSKFEHCRLFDNVLLNAIHDIGFYEVPYRISLNLPPSLLENSSFYKYFVSRCEEYNICPSRFKVEVTETEYYDCSMSLVKNILKLKQYGVGISIDDFGVGYSSLDKILKLPIDELKIDRIFILDSQYDFKKRCILESMSDLTRKLDIMVVAEGVENTDTYDFIKKLNINYFQGYLFSAPKPLGDLFG
ncbi:EAL domain-containing protein [Vibrio parahaemolyticus]|uniref:EAL domain-containing protein n=1 Tax=Vibrio parahaemolyticus TaxID=670 RepID=UPI00186A38A2|nr:EAL domain-containing protein [Vibrio parahaemolyticus]MBE4454432.1 EAL domain-containing protein [Vibrio parahaemolyticus]